MRVIVISAHPDDEVLGVGGALLKHKKNGDEIYWLIVTNIFEKDGFSESRVRTRQEEIVRVADLLGVKQTFKLDYPTMTLSSSSLIKMVPEISAIFQEVKPEIIYSLNRSDAHSDHRVIFDAVMACTKSFRYPFIKRVLMYECISETEFAPVLPEKAFLPNYFIDISEHLEQKLEIMKIYESELGEHPFPRSLENIKALAHFRGASVGVHYAEAFQLIKYIDK
ncbi:PIG-L deacetylase family protein [Pontibacter akesuensis]|uniref:N-acetylglucosaminyl deacetylase, LmbE family n=1 Tax=Pontibacter akesuensis TaxID=388950 RepID=A0A1I7H5Q3_9BACT|nr:PIG-L deacetylase family protein [Pontibacter akesuensis]GHA53267.1 GlcNAc-PI de-N-acetylase [Pontibacter akesuensis]SFU56027.1 N-acetylglucosaminyl deacetylase, LmbE family [Pontibacter akesuensis]